MVASFEGRICPDDCNEDCIESKTDDERDRLRHYRIACVTGDIALNDHLNHTIATCISAAMKGNEDDVDDSEG